MRQTLVLASALAIILAVGVFAASCGGGSTTTAGGATFSFTFDTPGTYAYHCGIHPSMTGEVIVQ